MAGIWTRNYYNLLTAAFLMDTTSTSTSTPADYTPPLRVRTTYGNYITPLIENGAQYGNTSDVGIKAAIEAIGKGKIKYLPYNTNAETLSDSYLTGIQFGSGTTPASYDDYKLTNLISSGLSVSASEGSLQQPTTFADNKYTTKRSYTITNTTSGIITVGEMGLLVRCGSSGLEEISVLVYHDVFDEPILLDRSESIIVTFTRTGEPYNYTPY